MCKKTLQESLRRPVQSRPYQLGEHFQKMASQRGKIDPVGTLNFFILFHSQSSTSFCPMNTVKFGPVEHHCKKLSTIQRQ